MYCKDCKFYKYDRTDDIMDEQIYEVKMEIKRGKCLNENLRYGWQLENESQLIYVDSEDWSGMSGKSLDVCILRRGYESKRVD